MGLGVLVWSGDLEHRAVHKLTSCGIEGQTRHTKSQKHRNMPTVEGFCPHFSCSVNTESTIQETKQQGSHIWEQDGFRKEDESNE